MFGICVSMYLYYIYIDADIFHTYKFLSYRTRGEVSSNTKPQTLTQALLTIPSSHASEILEAVAETLGRRK